MQPIIRMSLIALLSNVLFLAVDAKPLVSNSCNGTDNQPTRTAIELRQGEPITLTQLDGQTVRLAGNASGTEELSGRSVVAITFSPSGQGIGYGVETLPPQDVTPLLVTGKNEVRLTAVLPQDRAWLIVTAPCPTPTPLPIVTATPSVMPTITVASNTPIVPTPSVIRHAATGTEFSNGTGPVSEAEVRRTVPLLIGLVTLGAILLLSLGNWQRLRQWVRRLKSD